MTGQCTTFIQAKLEGLNGYMIIKDNVDLIKAIKSLPHHISTAKIALPSRFFLQWRSFPG
jgi:hypothetical protein